MSDERTDRWPRVESSLRIVVAFLDRLIAIFERAFVLIVCLLLCIAVVSYGVDFWDMQPAARNNVLVYLETHWKAVVIISGPLVLRPVLVFLERVREAFGMKADPAESQPDEPTENPARGNAAA